MGRDASASVRREFDQRASIRRLEDAYFEALALGKGGAR